MGGGGSKSQLQINDILNKAITETTVNVISKKMSIVQDISNASQKMVVGNLTCSGDLNISQNMVQTKKTIANINEENISELKSQISSAMKAAADSESKQQGDALDPLGTLMSNVSAEARNIIENEIENIITSNVSTESVTQMVNETNNKQELYVGIPAVEDLGSMAYKACSGIQRFEPVVLPRYSYYFPSDKDFGFLIKDIEISSGSGTTKQWVSSGLGIGSGTLQSQEIMHKSERVSKLYSALTGISPENYDKLFEDVFDASPHDINDINKRKKIKSKINKMLSGGMAEENRKHLRAAEEASEEYEKIKKSAIEKCPKKVEFFDKSGFVKKMEIPLSKSNPFGVFNIPQERRSIGGIKRYRDFGAAESVKVPEGCVVTLYSDLNGTGASMEVTENISPLNFPSFNRGVKSARISSIEMENFLEQKIKLEALTLEKKQLNQIEKDILSDIITRLNQLEAEAHLKQMKEAEDAQEQAESETAECLKNYKEIAEKAYARLEPTTAKNCDISQDMEILVVSSMIATSVTKSIMDSDVINQQTAGAASTMKQESTLGTVGDTFNKALSSLTSGPMLILIGFLAIVFLVFMLMKSE